MSVAEATGPESAGWTDDDWENLLLEIEHKQCTPFLGAGACAGVLPLGKDIAEAWSDKYGYPFLDRDNLVRVAQFLAVERGSRFAKYQILDEFRKKAPPDFTNPNEPHRVVADLELPIYITTNYDDFLTQALSRDKRREPRRETCRWHLARVEQPLGFVDSLEPSIDRPLVFHLHGILEQLESMVLTEDDYLDFLMYISEEQALIPPRIERAFTQSSLLFLGYSLDDMNFKVLFRKLAVYMRRNKGARHVSVQLAPRAEESNAEQVARAQKQQRYLEHHYGLQDVKVWWGTCEKFAADLRKRLK